MFKKMHFWNHLDVSFRVACLTSSDICNPFQRTVVGMAGGLWQGPPGDRVKLLSGSGSCPVAEARKALGLNSAG